MKLGRQGLWKEYVARQQRQLHGKFSNFKSTSQNIGDYHDAEYYVNITIGTPDQFFVVVLDTTSGSLVIPDVHCNECQNVRKFNSSKSSTYKKTSSYLQNNTDNGLYGQDFVKFGNSGPNQLTIPNSTFAQSLKGINVWTVDGIMGLGFTAQNPDNIDPPIITAVKSGILDSPVVTLFLESLKANSSNNTGGVITYGALDIVNCNRNVTYEPLVGSDAFEIILEEVVLGASQFSENWTASIDTAASFLLGPQLIVETFAKVVNATFDFQYDLYTIDCDAKLNFTLTIGSTVYVLTEKQMVVNYGSSVCIFGLLAHESDTWILGYPWFKAFCSILDYDSKRIGFASVINP